MRSRRPTADRLALASAVRELRSRRRVTQAMLAYDAALSTKFLGEIECASTNVSWGSLLSIVRALGSTMDELGELFERERATLPPADHGVAFCPSPEALAHVYRQHAEYRRYVEATRARGRMRGWT